MAFYDEIKPLYSCYRYKGDFVKIVKFKRRVGNGIYSYKKSEPKEQEREEGRFLSSISRSRSTVLQYALSNDWDYFFTGTIDGSKHDRFQFSSYYSRLSQFIRDERKRASSDIKYIFVPERHKDGAWHLHGLLRGLPDDSVTPFVPGLHPAKLVNNGYLNWEAYSRKFGFCSLGKIRDPIKVAFYITKYITKDLAANLRGSGTRLCFPSTGLRKAEHYGDCYYGCVSLDGFLSADYDFCRVGYGHLPWTFACEYFDGIEYPSSEPSQEVKPVQVSTEDFREWKLMQMSIEDYL